MIPPDILGNGEDEGAAKEDDGAGSKTPDTAVVIPQEQWDAMDEAGRDEVRRFVAGVPGGARLEVVPSVEISSFAESVGIPNPFAREPASTESATMPEEKTDEVKPEE